MKRLLSILVALVVLASGLRAQSVTTKTQKRDTTMEITYVVTDALIPGYLDINLRLLIDDTVASEKYLKDSLSFVEIIGGTEYDLKTQKVEPLKFDVVTVITDVSSSMWKLEEGRPVYMDSAKAITDSIMRTLDVPYAVNLYTFDEQLYRKTTSGPSSFMKVQRPAKARYTHLFENVDDALTRMSDASGRKILFIIGDGENDQNRNLEVKITKAELLQKIRALDTTYVIFPIILGKRVPEHETNFRQLVAATRNFDDRVIYNGPGQREYDYVADVDNWPMTHKILVKSENNPHIGGLRDIEARLEHLRDTSTYHLGGVYAPWNQGANWQTNSFAGGLLLILIFAVFAFVIPRQQWRDFKKKYVKHYWEIKKPGMRQYDPLTKFPFRDEDLIVVRCEHVTSLETWQYEGRRAGKDSGSRKRKNRCIYYPHKCDSGVGPGGSADFFNQVGIFKFLFWAFLGILGGILGWALWALFWNGNKVWLDGKLYEMALWPGLQERFGAPGVAPQADSVRMVLERFLTPASEEVAMGLLLPVSIVFLLSFANEAAQSRGSFRGLTLVTSIFRSLLRALFAGIGGALIFLGVALLQGFVFVKLPLIPGIIGLLLLGLLLTRILTTRSGIRKLRGLYAGLAAGLAAFVIYFVPMMLLNTSGFELPKMIAFMTFGGLAGFVMSRGAPSLEASEMEVWTGRKRYGKTHITDLLRKNEEVTIGRGPTATVRMKVRHTPALNAPGNATQTFAQLTLRNEVVYLIPEIFTEVNGEPIAPNEKVALFDGDKISFVHKSPSYLRYREGRSGLHPRKRRRMRRERRRRRARTKAKSINVSDDPTLDNYEGPAV
ncbi:MAG: hypothetical protein AAGN35_19045 [Bacteroidota bacterium]